MQEAAELVGGVVQVGMGVGAEHMDQYAEVVACSNSDAQPAKGKALRLQVQNFGLNEIRYTASFLKVKQMRGIRRRNIIVVRSMIRYVGGRQRGGSYQEDVQGVLSRYC